MGKLKNLNFSRPARVFHFFRSFFNETWLYTSASNHWTKWPDMIEARHAHGCSSFLLNGNQILAVSPGGTANQKSMEFLDLARENPKWIHGTFL